LQDGTESTELSFGFEIAARRDSTGIGGGSTPTLEERPQATIFELTSVLMPNAGR
jgi:hypothetical protein